MSRHILLVEDQRDDADLTVAALKQAFADLEVAVVEDGVEALEYLACTGQYRGRARDLPRVVLLDLNLPRMGGHQVLQAIRADPKTRHLPVIVLTSSLEDEDLMKSYELGVNSYVRKPVDFDEFATIAERIGEYWLRVNCVAPSVLGPRR